MIKILCLDDEAEMVDLLRLILERMGYEILAATRSLEALEILHREPVDILLQDLMRPEIDGWQFFQMLKADPVLYTLPVMVVTAKPRISEAALDIQLAGVDAYVTKPFGPQELLDTFKDVLQQRNLPLSLPHRLFEWYPQVPGLLGGVLSGDNEITPSLWRRLHIVLQTDAVLMLLDALNAEARLVQAGAVLRVQDLHLVDTRVTRRLLAMLDTEPTSHQAAAVQTLAVQTLGALKVREAVEALMALLRSQYESVRHAAACALRDIGDARAVKSMMRTLYTEHVELYVPACQWLGEIAEASAVPALQRVLLQGHASVQHSAVTALVRIGNQEARTALSCALQSDVDIARRTVWALGNIKGVSWVLDMLAQALAEGVPDVRCHAATALGNIGNLSGFLPLCAALQDAHHHNVRAAAARALGDLGLPDAVPYLIEALDDEQEWVSAAAAEALGKIGDTRAIEALIAALSHPDSWTRWQVTRALGQLGEDITHLLSKALTSGSWYTRQALIEVLAELAHKTADSPLLPQIVTALIWALEDRRAAIRRGAVRVLPTLEDPRIVPALLKTLRDEHWWVRRAAVRALHALGDARAVLPLVEVLRINRTEVQMAAARAIGDLGGVDVIDPLVAICIRADAETGFMAAIALTSLAVSDAVIARLDKVYGANPDIRLVIVKALADTRNAEFVPFLIQCLSSDVSQISATAARVLGCIGDVRAVAPLADILHAQETPGDPAWACAYALGQLGDVEGVPVLEAVAHGDARRSQYGWPVADAARRALIWIQWSVSCL